MAYGVWRMAAYVVVGCRKSIRKLSGAEVCRYVRVVYYGDDGVGNCN